MKEYLSMASIVLLFLVQFVLWRAIVILKDLIALTREEVVELQDKVAELNTVPPERNKNRTMWGD